MKQQRRNQYDSIFTTIEINVAKSIIRNAVNNGGWLEEDEQDLEQEIFAHLWKKRHHYIYQDRYANYVRKIVERKLLNLIEIRDAQKRKPDGMVLSMSEQYSNEPLSEKLTFEDTIPDESAIPPGDTRLEIYDRMWNVVKNEKPIFQMIFKLWLEGHTGKSMAKVLDKSRTAVSDQIQKFKQLMKDAGLDKYLK